MGVPVPQVLIRSQEARLANCAKGVLRFNWRIVQAPLRLVDYVVAHEIAHLVHPDRGRAVWALLGRVMPDYEAWRADLWRLGSWMVL
jgi:predicted metal-dependent hydrolase